MSDASERFCPKCGARGMSAFCPNDGTEMKPVVAKASTSVPVSPTSPVQAPPSPPAVSQERKTSVAGGAPRPEPPRMAKTKKWLLSSVMIVAAVVVIVVLWVGFGGVGAQRGQAVVTVVNGESSTVDMLLTIQGGGEMMSCGWSNGQTASMCQYTSQIAPGNSVTYTVGLATTCQDYSFVAEYTGGTTHQPTTDYICPGESLPVQLVV